MGSYLTFYLVPKKKENIEVKPLAFIAYSRSSEIYQAYYENLNPVFAGTDETVDTYTEVTPEDAKRVKEAAENDLLNVQNRLSNKIETYKDLNTNIPEDAIEDIMNTKEYIKELEDLVKELSFIYYWISDLEYSDFEKVYINIS